MDQCRRTMSAHSIYSQLGGLRRFEVFGPKLTLSRSCQVAELDVAEPRSAPCHTTMLEDNSGSVRVVNAIIVERIRKTYLSNSLLVKPADDIRILHDTTTGLIEGLPTRRRCVESALKVRANLDRKTDTPMSPPPQISHSMVALQFVGFPSRRKRSIGSLVVWPRWNPLSRDVAQEK